MGQLLKSLQKGRFPQIGQEGSGSREGNAKSFALKQAHLTLVPVLIGQESRKAGGRLRVESISEGVFNEVLRASSERIRAGEELSTETFAVGAKFASHLGSLVSILVNLFILIQKSSSF